MDHIATMLHKWENICNTRDSNSFPLMCEDSTNSWIHAFIYVHHYFNMNSRPQICQKKEFNSLPKQWDLTGQKLYPNQTIPWWWKGTLQIGQSCPFTAEIMTQALHIHKKINNFVEYHRKKLMVEEKNKPARYVITWQQPWHVKQL